MRVVLLGSGARCYHGVLFNRDCIVERRIKSQARGSPRRVVYPTRIVQALRVSGARHGVRSGGLEDCSGRRGCGIGVVRRYVLFILGIDIRKGVSILVDLDDARMCFSMHLILRRRSFFRL